MSENKLYEAAITRSDRLHDQLLLSRQETAEARSKANALDRSTTFWRRQFLAQPIIEE